MASRTKTFDKLRRATSWACAWLTIGIAVVTADERLPRNMSRLAPARIELVEPFRAMETVPVAFDPRGASVPPRPENRELIAPPPTRSANTLIDGIDIRVEPITELNIAIRPKSEADNQSVPQDFAIAYFAEQPTIHYGPAVFHEHFIVPSRRLASEFAYGPVYFEDRNLERHGTSIGLAQPLASAAHFLIRVPALPYLAAAQPPWNDYYPGDPYQPGRPAPRVPDWPVFDPKAATLEAGLAVGLILLVP